MSSNIDERIYKRVSSGLKAVNSAISEAKANTNGTHEAIASWIRQKNFKSYQATIRKMMISSDFVYYWRFVNGLRVVTNLDMSVPPTEPVSIVFNEDDSIIEVVLAPYFYKLDNDSKLFSIEHEVLHKALSHGSRVASLPNKSAASVAADLAVNTFIGSNIRTEDDIVIESHSPGGNIKPGHSVEGYYQGIFEQVDDGNSDGQGNSGGDGSGEGGGGGGGGGNSDPTDGGNQEGQGQGGNPPKSMDTHPWASDNRYNQRLEDALLNARAEIAGNSYGNMPGEVQEAIEAARPSKKRSWAADISSKLYDDRRKNGVWRLSYRRANRRDDQDIWPGRRRKEMPRIAVAIDTSGSMPTDMLQKIIDALPHLDRQARIGHVLQCDTQIHYNEQYNPTDLANIYGRGGTCFSPVFDWLRDDFKGQRYSYLIYFTDGEAMPITDDDVRDGLKVIWVDTSGRGEDYSKEAFQTGSVYYMDDVERSNIW